MGAGMKEREISLLELVTEIMLHWRAMLVWMAVGAVLAGAFSAVRSYQAVKAADGQGQQAELSDAQRRASLEEQLTDAQLQNVNYVIDYEAVYKEKAAYQKDSILMQLDPGCIYRADLTFFVNADSWRRTASIEKAYEDMVQGGELAGYVEGQVQEENAGRIKDVLSLARGAGSLPEGTDTFRISMVHFDRSVLQDMADAVASFFKNKQGQIEKTMGSHEVVVANRSESVVSDMDILEKQKAALDSIASMQAVILQYKEAFTAEEQQYYDFMAEAYQADGAGNVDAAGVIDGAGSVDGAGHANGAGRAGDVENAERAGEEMQEQDGAAQAAFPGISKRYLVLGMFFAAFIYVFQFFVRYVFSNKLHSADSLQELYGIPQLGMVPQQQKGGRMFGKVDQWILSLRDSGRRRFTKDEALQLAAAAVRMAAVKEGMERVCLAGCGLSGLAVEICEVVRDSLAGEGIQVEILPNILYDAQAMGRLEEADGAVLVAQVQSTLYSEVAKEKELLVRQGVVILGGILADSPVQHARVKK